jgi:hypothetical protein
MSSIRGLYKRRLKQCLQTTVKSDYIEGMYTQIKERQKSSV